MAEAKKSYMTKEQLEQYLADLRNNRPQRPSASRPISLSSTSKSRWSLLRSSTASVPPPSSEPVVADPSVPSLYSATPPPALSRRESKLIRKHSSPTHKRANTAASILSFKRSAQKPNASDGVEATGRTDDTSPTTSRASSLKQKRATAPAGSLRGFVAAGNGILGRTHSMSSGSSSSSGNSERKKRVSWKLPGTGTETRPTTAGRDPPVLMPPCHPPKPEDANMIEKELTAHFEALSAQDVLPTVAPLRINKTSPGSPESKGSLTGRAGNVPSQAPSTRRREYGAPLPPRPAYVEPWKLDPTQNNHPKYTTNPDPLATPPSSGSDEDEAEILKELGRRPLPKAGGPSGNARGPTPPQESPVRRNTTKYGAQVQPPPPVIGIVEPPRISVNNNKPPAIPTISLPDDKPSVPPPSINVTPSINLPRSHSTTTPPSINVTPSINLPRSQSTTTPPHSHSAPQVPTFNLPSDPTTRPSGRPLPHPRGRPTSVYSSASTGRTRASCNLCRQPIEGRIVTAGSLRFHSECFRCDHCQTPLEHVGFYPEPKEARSRRLEKAGLEDAGLDANGTGVRFYCHLDFHELFSPRCKSCKTPIEGEVVVACGSTWHQGHFFCAECGDPFDAKSKFVEKDGYAWCVGCYTKRYSGRCKKCRKPVTETVVKALGGEWHEECFCCTECGGAFDDGRFFVRNTDGREIPVCVTCEERRLKA